MFQSLKRLLYKPDQNGAVNLKQKNSNSEV